jgi:hypothetical protein
MITIRSAVSTDVDSLWDAERRTAMKPGLLAARPAEIPVDVLKAKIGELAGRGRCMVAEA